MIPGADRSAGYTLAEATVALALAGMLTLCLAVILAAVGRLASAQAKVAAIADTERTVAAILGLELRALTAADATFGSDSVRLRAFRGAGRVCAADDDLLVVAYHGVRQPDADKDSVLLIWPSGEAAAQIDAVTAAGAGSCAEGVTLRAPWRSFAPAAEPSTMQPPSFAVVFETGAYSIAAAALRYRRGAGGRQPLTEANLAAASSLSLVDLADARATAAVVRLLGIGSTPTTARQWRLLMPQGSAMPAAPGP